ncbi:hypothetical protein BRARA_E00584 [Brassica rapa]|uniref:ADP-ribosyl cyclase/cyclic ADP-ribose hydrolase n=1 Tax=Brassica campestris TaxID=3711 RepID=A0A397ZAZ8_BRACM|nr:hypothetical protein BRARA_E00584 [Brassica rapa]
MERGRSIEPELTNAIQGSKISVVAFSKNFANSSWCLDELVEIMKCRKDRGLIVIPIFYDVDPSHVKKQSHSFGEIFNNTCQTCQGKTEEDKLQWRTALTEAATIVGEDSRNWRDEAEMIETIVNDISNKLNSTKSSDFADFVGIEDHITKMTSLMNLESKEVITVGVWGPSGVGKTTIGRALFHQISCQFLPRHFIDKTMKNFTGAKSDDYNTHLFLQKQFLAEVLDQKDIKIDCLGAVEERLRHKRALFVFDDQVPLEALVRKTTEFGPRSRVVVISEDRQFLRACGIGLDRIYEVALPSEELAFHMFCRCAFGQDSPPDGFLELTIEAVKLTGNFPLCLNVLGSSLKGMMKEEWVDRLPELRICKAEQIDKKLRDSYDRLKEEDKAIFRHIV